MQDRQKKDGQLLANHSLTNSTSDNCISAEFKRFCLWLFTNTEGDTEALGSVAIMNSFDDEAAENDPSVSKSR